jgi:hypothetical protein
MQIKLNHNALTTSKPLTRVAAPCTAAILPSVAGLALAASLLYIPASQLSLHLLLFTTGALQLAGQPA